MNYPTKFIIRQTQGGGWYSDADFPSVDSDEVVVMWERQTAPFHTERLYKIIKLKTSDGRNVKKT